MVLTCSKGMKVGKLLSHVHLTSSLSAAPKVGLREPESAVVGRKGQSGFVC